MAKQSFTIDHSKTQTERNLIQGTSRRILFVLLPLLVCLIGLYSWQNIQRIQLQNQIYTKEAAVSEAATMDELLDYCVGSIQMYADTIDSDGDLSQYVKNSPFQLLFVTDITGTASLQGTQKDFSDMEFYVRGMQGKNGMQVDFDKKILGEVTIAFYAPMMKESTVTGVLVGILTQEELENRMNSENFGARALTYLVSTEDRIIADTSENREMVGKYLFSDFHAEDTILSTTFDDLPKEQQTAQALRAVLYNRGSFGYRYKHDGRNESAYVVNLSHSDYSLMKIFPQEVSAAMESSMLTATVVVCIIMILLFTVYLLAVLVDNRRRQARLKQENQNVRRVLEAFYGIYDRFCVVDLESDTYEYLQFGELEKYGIKQSGNYSELRTGLSEMVDETAADGDIWSICDSKGLRERLTVDAPVTSYEVRMFKEQPRWESIVFIGLDYDGNSPRKVIFAVQDITGAHEESIRMNQMLREAIRDANAANNAKSDFLSRMSHDIRTPLNGIIGMAAIASNRMDDPERVKDCLGKITASGDFLLGLVNEILDISKIEAGMLELDEEPVDLSALTSEVRDLILPMAAEKQQELSFCSKTIHNNVFSDKVRLKNIAINIISNAIKYTPAGGRIDLTLTEENKSNARHSIYTFECRDNGIGMTEEFMAELFEPFSRAEGKQVRSEQGTGLGLCITRSMARLMGGDITVSSKPGEGSLFRVQVLLKLGDENMAQQDPEESESIEDLDFAGSRCLIVDDNELNREIACEVLGLTGIAIETAEDGREAVEMYTSHPAGYYQIIFMDIQMPVMDGHTATRAIRDSEMSDCKEIPIVAMTANAYAEDVRAAKDAGMNDHMAKPLDISRLCEIMRTYLKGGTR